MKIDTISEYIRTLVPGHEIRILYSESNRVLAHRAARKAKVKIVTKKDGPQLIIRLASEVVLDGADELGLTVTPINLSNPHQAVTNVQDLDRPYIWWAAKLREPVPLEVLQALGKDGVRERAEDGRFQKAYNHPLISEGRNDADLFEEAGGSTKKKVE